MAEPSTLDDRQAPAAETTPPEVGEATKQRLVVLYQENADFSRYFLEWRHKVINFFLLVVSGTFIAVKWCVESASSQYIVSFPLVIGAMLCVALCLMDDINRRVQNSAWDVGASLELDVFGRPGMYSNMRDRSSSPSTFTYSRILRVLFLASAGIFIVLAVALPFINIRASHG